MEFVFLNESAHQTPVDDRHAYHAKPSLPPLQEILVKKDGKCSIFPIFTNDKCDGRMSFALMVAMLVLGFVTFFVNLGVIIRTIKILRQGHDNKPAFYFIGNLALSDMAIGLYVIIAFLLHITNKSDLWEHPTCTLQIAVAVTACQETIFSIVLIAVDKYLYICHGLRYHFLVTTNRVYIALAASWFISLIIGFLPAMGMQETWEDACGRCVFAQIVSKGFTILFFVTSVAVPYAVVVSLYSVLLVLAVKMQKARYGGSYTGSESARSSNFRLSFMSKKSLRSNKSTRSVKSTKSAVSATHSAKTDVSVIKASRRKIRKKELEEYKSNLPGRKDMDMSAKLISYKSNEEAVESKESKKNDTNKELEKEFTTKLMDNHLSDEENDKQIASNEFGDSGNDCSKRDSFPNSFIDSVGDPMEIKQNGQDEVTETTITVEKRTEDENVVIELDDSTGIDVSTNRFEKEDAIDTSVRMHRPNNSNTIEEVLESRTAEAQDLVIPPPGVPKSSEVQLSSNEASPTALSASDEYDTKEEPSDEGKKPWFPSKYFNRVVSDTRDKVLFLKKCRAVKTVFLIIGSFSATYVPFVIGSMIYAVEEKKRECLLHMLNTLLYCAVVANSLANPLIYAYGYREFRMKSKKFKGVFAMERKRKAPKL